MPNVNVSPDLGQDSTHDMALSSRGQVYGLNFARGTDGLQRVPISGTSTLFNFEQTEWNGGRGRIFAKADPNGYFDAHLAWGLQSGKLFAVPQIRFAKGLRSEDTFFPGDGTDSTEFKALYANGVSRYISASFTASATYSAAYARLMVRRIGNPGTLTLELCADNSGSPGTVLKTVTKTSADVEVGSIISLTHRLKFTFESVQSLSASTAYHIKVYGASGDDINNHWEVLVDTATSGAKTSTDNSTWSSAAAWKFYYRVCDADIKRRFAPFFLDGGWYVVSINDAGTDSKIYLNGDKGTVSSATGTTLVKTSAGWTVNRWSTDGASVFIYDGKGTGQLRTISSNTADTLTVPTWDITPDTSSKYVIVHTRYWKEITTSGTSLGVVTDAPTVIHNIAVFPRGASTQAIRMTAAYVCSVELLVYADFFRTFVDTAALKTVGIVKSTSKITQYSIPDLLTGVNVYTTAIIQRVVGTKDFWINNAVVHDKKLYVIKENKMYAMSGTQTEEVSIAIDDLPSRTNGLAAISHQNYLYWSWGGSIQRMIQSNVADIMNFKPNYDGLPSDRKSYPAWATNFLNWVMVGMDGGGSYKSSVLLWNDQGWMELFRGFEAGSRVRGSFMMSQFEQRPRMWFDVDGDYIYMDMPLNDNNPLQDAGISHEHEFCVITGAVDANEQSNYKMISSIRFLTESFNGSIGVDYQIDDDVWTNTWKPLPDDVTVSPEKIIALTFGKVKKIAFRIRGYSNKPLTPTVITSYRVEGWKIDTIRHQWVGRFDIGFGMQTRQGDDDHNPDELEKWLLEIAQNMNEVQLHSKVAGDHLRYVVVAAPTIARNATEEGQWRGTMTLMMREK